MSMNVICIVVKSLKKVQDRQVQLLERRRRCGGCYPYKVSMAFERRTQDL